MRWADGGLDWQDRRDHDFQISDLGGGRFRLEGFSSSGRGALGLVALTAGSLSAVTRKRAA